MTNWKPSESAVSKLQNAQQSMAPGTLGGRVRQAATVPDRPRTSQDVGIEIYVQDFEPEEAGFKALWYDTSASST
jgi:hypothetical protein